jgi:hypothetical protein
MGPADVVLFSDLKAQSIVKAPLMKSLRANYTLVDQHRISTLAAFATVVLRTSEPLDVCFDKSGHLLHLVQAIDMIVFETIVHRTVDHRSHDLFFCLTVLVLRYRAA